MKGIGGKRRDYKLMVSAAVICSLWLSLCIALSPIATCVNGNWCHQDNREGGRDGSVGGCMCASEGV